MTFVIVMGFHQIIVVMNDVKRHTYKDVAVSFDSGVQRCVDVGIGGVGIVLNSESDVVNNESDIVNNELIVNNNFVNIESDDNGVGGVVDDRDDDDYIPSDCSENSDEYDMINSEKERLRNERTFLVYEEKLFELLAFCSKCGGWCS